VRGVKSDFGARRALDLFDEICVVEEHCKTILTMDAICNNADLVEQLVHMVDVYHETEATLRALAFITRSEAVALTFVRMGALKVVLRAMSDRDAAINVDGRFEPLSKEKIMEHGCRVLSNVSFNGDVKTELVRIVPLDLLIGALRMYPKNLQLQIHTTNVLGVLALHSDTARDQMAARGAVPCVLAGLAEFPNMLRMQEIGAWCLRTLSISQKTKRQIVEGGGVPLLVAAMRAFANTEFLLVQASAALK
jgi:hypothetical protein